MERIKMSRGRVKELKKELEIAYPDYNIVVESNTKENGANFVFHKKDKPNGNI